MFVMYCAEVLIQKVIITSKCRRFLTNFFIISQGDEAAHEFVIVVLKISSMNRLYK